jgi:hypothetical protein
LNRPSPRSGSTWLPVVLHAANHVAGMIEVTWIIARG